MRWVNQLYHFIIFIFLMLFRPAELFHRINTLDWYKDMLQQWIKNQNMPDNIKILEVGCATGLLSQALSNTGHTVTAIDFSESMIDKAKQKQSNVDFSVADATHLPFEDNAFDLVISSSLINIIDDKEQALKEIKRVCKPSGAMSVLVPDKAFQKTNFVALSKSLSLSGFSSGILNRWNNNAPKMDEEHLKQLFKTAGITSIVSHRYLNGMVLSVSAKKY